MKKNGSEPESINVISSTESPSADKTKEVLGMIQTVHKSQSRLIVLADQKANALIGILTIIFTILFSNIQRLSELHLIGQIAFFCFILMEVGGVAFALLVIFPKNISVKCPETIEQMSNPLFFGIYTHFKEQEYVTYLLNKLHTEVSASELLLTNYYQVGTILKKKYSQLKRAYMLAAGGFTFLLIGLMAGFLSTIIEGR